MHGPGVKAPPFSPCSQHGRRNTIASAGAALEELAVWHFLCSRPLCALLPRFPALRCLALAYKPLALGVNAVGFLLPACLPGGAAGACGRGRKK